MAIDRRMLLDWIEADRELLVRFLREFVQARSPNPPGDTREATAFVRRFLDAEDLAYRVIAPNEAMPNIVAAFDGGAPGRHLVLNGHIDVFAVEDESRWTHGPWSAALVDGKIYGRGVADMKAGTTASIFTYRYLHRLRDQLRGRLTLTVVSDEETFGPWGARYLMENHSEVHGDCCLSGEPSSPHTLRFGEKGLLWLGFTVTTRGSHGAYPHASESASKIAARLVADLESLIKLPVDAPAEVTAALNAAQAELHLAQGQGAAEIVTKVTVNVGRVQAGIKVNMTPSRAELEVDVRLPVGVTREQVQAAVEKILTSYPQVTVRELNHNAPSWCDPDGPMVRILRANVKELRGFKPKGVVSLGATDTRLWRYVDVPAYVYGPAPIGMGSVDEYVEVEEFLHVVRTHVLSAFDYLSAAA
jgi:succinyl-diaminopimelate desuccinylase